METGQYKIGINTEKDKTGKGNAVRIIKVKSVTPAKEEHEEEQEEKLFYALSGRNMKIYKVNEGDFDDPGYQNPKVEELKTKSENKFKSYIGFDFGEVISPSVIGYKNLLEDVFGKEAQDITDEDMEKGHLVYLGVENDEVGNPDTDEYVRMCWVTKKDTRDGGAMNETMMEKNEFLKNVLIPIEQPKRMTVHYINKNGEKTSAAVDQMTEIKDMEEFLYKFDN